MSSATVNHEIEMGDNQPEPSNRDIMQMLQAMSSQLQKFEHSNEVVDTLRAEVLEMHQENKTLKAQLELCHRKQEDTEQTLKESVYNAKLAREKSDMNEQYSRRNNIKVLFVEESQTSWETAEASEKIVLDIFHNKLGLHHIKAEQIEIAHRIGLKQADKHRPIIVKFISRKSKQEVMKNRSKLKGKKIVIVEDLTKLRYALFQQAASHPGIQHSWTIDGKIFVQDVNGKKHKIEKWDELNRLPLQASSPSESTGRRTKRKANRRFQWRNIFEDSFSPDKEINNSLKGKTTYATN